MRLPRGHALAAVLLVVLTLLALLLLAAPAGKTSAAAEEGASPVRTDDGARVVGQAQVAPNIVDLTVQSPALGRTGTVRLITPRGWAQREHGERWPVLYLLHGCCDVPASWTTKTDVARLRQLRDVLVVTPEAGAVGFYSDWWNHGAGGPPAWETFHLREVRRLLERGYGAGRRRVIAGLSMSGFGALSYAARHPRMFRAAASYSGVVHPLFAPGALLPLIGDFVPDASALWGDPVAQRAIWEAHDPFTLASRLHHLPLFLSVGDGTAGPFDAPGRTDGQERFLHDMNAAFAARLEQLHIRATTDFYGPGTHTWPYWERELHRSLPLLHGALQRDDDD
jgi:diacylglycerol O-acyltransferase / trehalose O-mycolyltransferase / mycolyltransferase Ag85